MTETFVAIYIRVSTLDQAREGYSLAAQRRVLEDYCAKVGEEVYKVYADEGISGKDIKHRPAFRELIEDAKARKFETICVWALSRFTRSVSDLYKVSEILTAHGIRLVSITEGFDTRTPTGRAMMGVIGVFAQMERELTAERVTLAMTERARQGKRTCSDVLGYERDGKDGLKIVDEEAAVVRLIFEKYIAYEKMLPVSELLCAMGIKGKRGGTITAESVRKIITCPLYIGYYRFKGELYKGNFEPIVSEAVWKKAQRIRQRTARKK